MAVFTLVRSGLGLFTLFSEWQYCVVAQRRGSRCVGPRGDTAAIYAGAVFRAGAPFSLGFTKKETWCTRYPCTLARLLEEFTEVLGKSTLLV